MTEEEEMSIDERRKYLHKMWGKYRKASKKAKGQMLDDMEHVTGLNRKTIIRILNGRLSRKKRTRQRGLTYGTEVINTVSMIAKALDYPCAERIKPQLVFMAKHLMRHRQWYVEQETLDNLERISISTIKRMLPRIKTSQEKIAEKRPPKRRRHTIREAYPMRRIPWDIPSPGHFETDLVMHCNEDTSGDFINTIQMTDVATGWSEIEAVFGRSFRVMKDGFAQMMARIPFPIIEIHPDNGCEFFNQHLLRFWKESVPTLELSRSRPYHKNDNRFVEENNHSLVRAYIGHGRLDTLAHLTIMRQLYADLWIYHNFFQPVMKTIRKDYKGEIHYSRVFDAAKPPLDRLISTGILPHKQAEHLLRFRDQVNIFDLRNRLDQSIYELWRVPSSKIAQPVNIFDTLRKEENLSVTFSFEPSIPVE